MKPSLHALVAQARRGSRAVRSRVPADVLRVVVELAEAWVDPTRWTGMRFTPPPGATRIGAGTTRVVWAVGEYAVKLPRSPEDDDTVFNRQEAAVYRRAPSKLRRLLLPVLAADPKGLWLVMPRATEATREQSREVCRRALEAAPWLTADELDCGVEANAGVWQGGVYLLDYPVPLPSSMRGSRTLVGPYARAGAMVRA